MSEISLTNREVYARSFRNYFGSKFDMAMADGKDEFEVSKREFDAYMMTHKYTHHEFIPEKGSAEWVQYRDLRNMVRKEMNHASAYGVHGEPPYRVDYVGGRYVVRLLSKIVKVTHEDMAKRILSLVASKDKEFTKMHNYLVSNLDRLPPALQAQLAVQDRMFKMSIRSITHTLNDYLGEIGAVYGDAMKAITDSNHEEMLRLEDHKEA